MTTETFTVNYSTNQNHLDMEITIKYDNTGNGKASILHNGLCFKAVMKNWVCHYSDPYKSEKWEFCLPTLSTECIIDTSKYRYRTNETYRKNIKYTIEITKTMKNKLLILQGNGTGPGGNNN